MTPAAVTNPAVRENRARRRLARKTDIAARNEKKAQGIPFAKPLPLAWFKEIIHDPKISHQQLAVFVHGALSANKNTGNIVFAAAKTVGACTGVNREEISRRRTELCQRGLFRDTGKRQGKYSRYEVLIPEERLQHVPIPFGLRKQIHLLTPSEFRLLLYLLVSWGWDPILGCVGLMPEPDYWADAALSRASCYRAFEGLIAKGFLHVAALSSGRMLCFVSRKAGFVKPPLCPTQRLRKALTVLGDDPYTLVDMRAIRGALSGNVSNNTKQVVSNNTNHPSQKTQTTRLRKHKPSPSQITQTTRLRKHNPAYTRNAA
jgi:hypothetical protein